jgi:TP901 family phage tail tape measure protein
VAVGGRSAGEISFDVVGDTSQLASSVEQGLNAAFLKMFVGGVGAAALVKASGGLRNFVAAGIADMNRFQTEMTRVFQVLPDMSDAAMAEMAQDITDLSNQYGVAVDKIAQATAVAAGRGISDLDAFEAATTRLTATVGGDAKNIANVTSAAMNQYGEGVLGAAEATDILYESARRSGLNVDNFGKALYDVLPSATSLGISMEETAATIATMTAAGTPAAVATTRLRTFLYELGRETTKSGEAFRSVAGLSFTEFINKGGTVAQAIDVLTDAQKKNGVQLRDMVDSFYTADQILALSGPNAERYAKSLNEITNSSGSVEEAQKKAFETVDYQLGIAREQLANTRREFGSAFGPLQLAAIKGLNSLLSQLVEPVRQLSSAISGFIEENRPAIDEFGRSFEEAFGQAIDRTITAVTFLGPILGQIALNLMDVAEAGANVWRILSEIFAPVTLAFTAAFLTVVLGITQAMSFFANIINNNQTAFKALIAAMAAVLVTMKLITLVTRGIIAAKLAWIAVTKALRGAILVTRGAMILLNMAIMANPIGAVVLALIAAAAAFVVLWRESETFRKVVVSAFNTIKNAAATGINFVVKVMAKYFDFQLSGIEAVLRAAGRLPKWLGGGAFDSAADAVASLRAGIASVAAAVDDLAARAKAANWELSQTLSAGGVSMTGGNKLPPGAYKPPPMPQAPAGPGVPPSGSVFDITPDDSAAKKAASDAKRAAEALKTSLATLFRDLNKYAKDAGKQSLSTISTNYERVVTDMKEAIVRANEAGNRAMAAALKKQLARFKAGNDRLVALGKRRDKVLEQLDKAKDSLQNLKDESKSFTDSIKNNVKDLGSVMRDTGGINVTFTGMRNNLRKAILQTKQFTTAINQLRGMGLNETSLRQIVEAGPGEGLRQAMILARSGQGGVNQINQLQGYLEAAGADLATGLNNEFYTAGIKAAEGLVKGLDSQHAALVKAMDRLATTLVTSIKNKLKIKSPSQIMDEEVGEMIPAGVARGIRRGGPDVAAAMDKLAAVSNSSSFGPGSIQVNGVSDPKAAQRAGYLVGVGIREVLSENLADLKLRGEA